jgi:hypothetical protein
VFFGEPEGNNLRRQLSERGAQGCPAFLAGPPSILRRRPSRLRACSRSSGRYRNWTNLCIVRSKRWCFRTPNWMTASGPGCVKTCTFVILIACGMARGPNFHTARGHIRSRKRFAAFSTAVQRRLRNLHVGVTGPEPPFLLTPVANHQG